MKRLRDLGPVIARKFDPKPYHGGALIIRVSERNDDPWEDYYLGWKQHIHGPLESVEIETDHEGILREPAVRIVAQQIGRRLEEVEIMSNQESEEYASVP